LVAVFGVSLVSLSLAALYLISKRETQPLSRRLDDPRRTQHDGSWCAVAHFFTCAVGFFDSQLDAGGDTILEGPFDDSSNSFSI
jgi:hypothetical protein